LLLLLALVSMLLFPLLLLLRDVLRDDVDIHFDKCDDEYIVLNYLILLILIILILLLLLYQYMFIKYVS
jgi:hypothetical protein